MDAFSFYALNNKVGSADFKNLAAVFDLLGITNPTEADTTTVMNFLNKLFGQMTGQGVNVTYKSTKAFGYTFNMTVAATTDPGELAYDITGSGWLSSLSVGSGSSSRITAVNIVIDGVESGFISNNVLGTSAGIIDTFNARFNNRLQIYAKGAVGNGPLIIFGALEV